jgi:hypothetical protein
VAVELIVLESRKLLRKERSMKRMIIILAIAIILGTGSAYSQGTGMGFRGWGPRLGLTIDPDQIHFGIHADFGDFTQRLRFQPNFELGFGDNLTVGTTNFEVNYRFRQNWAVWTPYLGGGLGIIFVDRDNSLGGGNDTDLGANIMGGIEKGIAGGDRFFIEAKIGLADAPDMKFTVGWTFGS